MRRRPKPPRRLWLDGDPFEVPVKRQVKIEARLLAVGDHVEPRGELIMHRGHHRILLHLRDIRRPKLIEMLRGKLQPTWKRIAADDRRTERPGLHASGV